MSRKEAIRSDYIGLRHEGLVKRQPDSAALLFMCIQRPSPRTVAVQIEGPVWSSVVKIGFGHFWVPRAGVLKPMNMLAGIQQLLCKGNQWHYFSQRSNL